jgi:hypothetical protein
MHGAAQKASKLGETVAQDSFTKTNRFPFPTWTVRRLSFFGNLFSFFDCFPSFSFFPFFFLFFLTYRTREQGWGRPRGGGATGVRTRWRMDEQRR